MNGERWERTKQILEEALLCTPEERTGYLDSACGPDRELRAEVESLIAHHLQAGNEFLAVAAPELFAITSTGKTPQTPLNRTIGNYRLIEEIGRGGMGVVWRAEQIAPLRRQVALKLIKAGMYDDAVLKRFETERQSLAIMDHPSIAKVFDAGATLEGQPYFVMEYVPGVPITDYCDQKRLKIRDRLELFIQVCEGVQHAHQKAIIHRDLKPANILVQEIDGKPVPRIIDFGLAKATVPQVAGTTLFTQTGAFVGTPGYMSPEQCDPSAQDVDTRTDVYALGVVLYVLLTGSLPFEGKEWGQKPFGEILHLMREQDPSRPSAKVSSERETSSTTAEARGTESKQLVSMLRGDLDWITMKAVEKDRTRRYGTPSELAGDITRYLKNDPVIARPASVSYRIQKYVHRHRYSVAGAAVLVVLLLAFAIAQNVQLRRTRRERDRADRIADFMTGIFKVSDPYQKLGTPVTAREVLDKASKDIETGLSKDPELQAHMMYVMAMSYLNLGEYDRARVLFERSIQVSSAARVENPETLHVRQRLAWTLFREGRLADAEAQDKALLEIERRTLGSDNEGILGVMGDLATIVDDEGHTVEAEKIQREVLEKQKRVLGPEAHYTLASMDNLAAILVREGRFSEADQLEQQTLEIQRRVFGADNLNTINYMLNAGEIKFYMGADDEAEKSLQQVLELQHRLLGPNQPEAAETVYFLAAIAAKRGQVDQAISLLNQAVDHGLLALTCEQIGQDPLFNSLHGDPRFAPSVAHAKQVAARKTAK
jgi:serine/threonine protein kinase